MSKYYSQKTVYDGIKFDSKKEARRFWELQQLQRAGLISGLKLQVPFELLPAQYEESHDVYKRGPKKGQPKQGRCIEQSVVYVADFVYTENGRLVVEDTKGVRTKDYILKRKMFRWKFGEEYEFREV